MAGVAPLAERMRPKNLDEFIGQKHLVGDGKVLTEFIKKGYCPSLIFWGPPGVGKTTLANILARQMKVPFIKLSAINAGVKDVREAIATSKKARKAILFIDEIHRFNKAQQDSLLGAVEDGTIILIGATTENPSFEVISALQSRCQIYVLESLEKEDLEGVLERAVKDDVQLSELNIDIKESDAILRLSGGDARNVLNILELVVESNKSDKITITNELVGNVVQQKLSRYDKSGEQHYDIISAFIKSLRGSDPNGAVYWLARMIEGGEDPKFIARRMVILASEDVGNANPTALVLANSCFEAINKIGWPEGRIILSQCAVYLATSPKSNATYEAINKAQALVRQSGDQPVPLHLRNAPTKLMKQLDYGKNYKYSHSGQGNFMEQEYLPERLSGLRLYEPGNNPRENDTRRRLKELWKDKYGY